MTDSTKWFWLSIVVIAVLVVYLLSPILTPFMFAAILAYMGDPIVDRLEKWRLSRTLAVVVVFAVFGGLLLLLMVWIIPMLERQFLVLAHAFPGYIDLVQQRFLPWLQQQTGLELSLDTAQLKQSLVGHWKEAGGFAGNLAGYITRSSLVLMGWIANLLLVPVVTFYLLRDWDVLVARIHELLPRRNAPMIGEIAKSSDEVLGAFLRGQLMVMLSLAVIYSIGLSLAGLDLAILIGIAAGLLSFVPYMGLIVGIILASIAALLQFQDVTHLGYLAIVFSVAQVIEGTVLTPLLIGNRIGLHPITVIFAVLAGGQLFGFFGILLALPMAAVIAVILRYIHQHYLASSLYTKT